MRAYLLLAAAIGAVAADVQNTMTLSNNLDSVEFTLTGSTNDPKEFEHYTSTVPNVQRYYSDPFFQDFFGDSFSKYFQQHEESRFVRYNENGGFMGQIHQVTKVAIPGNAGLERRKMAIAQLARNFGIRNPEGQIESVSRQYHKKFRKGGPNK